MFLIGVLTLCPYKGRCGNGQRRYRRVKHFPGRLNAKRREKGARHVCKGEDRKATSMPAIYVISILALLKSSSIVPPHYLLDLGVNGPG